MRNIFQKDSLYKIYTNYSLQFSSGRFVTSPDLYIPINEYGLGIHGQSKTGTYYPASFVGGIGIYSILNSNKYTTGIFINDAIYFNEGNKIGTTGNYSYSSIDPYTGTLSVWIKPYWDGDDGENHFIVGINHTNCYLSIEKKSTHELYFKLCYDVVNYTDLHNINYNCSGWAGHEWHHLAMIWNKNSIDGTDYVNCYVDNVKITHANNSVSIGSPSFIDKIYLGSISGTSSYFDGEIANLIIDQNCWKDTKANATAIGLGEWQSVEWQYNGGSGIKPICDINTGFMLVVE